MDKGMVKEDIGNLRPFLYIGRTGLGVYHKNIRRRVCVVTAGHHKEVLNCGVAGISFNLLFRKILGHLVRKGQQAFMYCNSYGCGGEGFADGEHRMRFLCGPFSKILLLHHFAVLDYHYAVKVDYPLPIGHVGE